MGYRIETIAPFRRAARRLIKKYPSLKQELALLGEQLSKEPIKGSPLGNNCYKIRIAIKSKGKGASGGARIITHVVHVSNQIVYLLTIYDKSDRESISNNELKGLIQLIE